MAIEQHPIPQDVAGYKFRLIGEMTIKQFAFLASGIILGLIIYSLPLPFFFKYPLAAIAVGLGAGIAFLPIEGRPMDKWLIAFIKSIYSPTEYVWQKQEGGEVITAAKATTPPVAPTPKVTPSPTTTPSPATPTTPISPTPAAPPAVPPVAPAAPARSIEPQAPAPTEPKVVAPAPAPTPIITTLPKPVTPPAAPVQVQAPITPPVPAPPEPKPTPTSPTAPAAVNLPVPFTPTTPNTLVGMTLTPDGKILDGALIEIRSKGLSLRATKSNQLGQFLFAKPLENGLYQIVTEKPGFTFDTYSIDLRGQIIKPLKLQAKAHV